MWCCTGEDQQKVWQDIAAALRDSVLQLEPQVPQNPNQVQERPDIAQWEAKYQARRQRRQQHPDALQAWHAPELAFTRQPGVGRLTSVVRKQGYDQVELPQEPHQECDLQDITIPQENPSRWGTQQQQHSTKLGWSWIS